MHDNEGAQVRHVRYFGGPHWDQYDRMDVLGEGEVCVGRNKAPLGRDARALECTNTTEQEKAKIAPSNLEQKPAQ